MQSIEARLSDDLVTIDRLHLTNCGKAEPMQVNVTNPRQPRRANWLALQIFADQILVPADPTNRADAGAGLTDND